MYQITQLTEPQMCHPWIKVATHPLQNCHGDWDVISVYIYKRVTDSSIVPSTE